MGQSETDIVATELERVLPKMPALFEREGPFFSTLEKKQVEVISNREMRIPLELRPGGKFGHYDPEGGDMGLGGGHYTDKAVITPAFLKHGVQFTAKAQIATDDRRKAIVNNTRKLLADAMKEFRRNCESLSMTPGNGVIGTVSANSNAGTSTLTLDGDGFGAKLIRYGQDVNIYDSGLSAKRTNGSEIPVTFHDLANKTIKVTGNLTDTVPTDVVVSSGLSGATPTSIKGVPYHNSNGSVGNWLGMNRANFPEIRANRVDGGNSPFTLPLPRLAINKIGDRVGLEAMNRVEAWMHPAQVGVYEELGQLVQLISQMGESKGLDRYFGGAMQMAGAPVKKSFTWDKTRIDFIDLDVWGRAEMQPIGFYEVDGQKIFPLYGVSGGIKASNIFYIVAAFDIFMNNPAASAYIDQLAVPSGY